ncbi:MAG: inositol monophosphatase [Candidatus Niyogibacteria bacterium]|nr:inositol monophosphatase [Candidatus Niyogibacteria bacterium]
MERFIKKTAKEAGKIILDLFGKIDVHYTKNTLHDVVTKADLVSQKIIVDAIKKEHPSHGIVGEEENLAHQSDADYVWYIDPLDGTKNFSTRAPLFGINIGLAHNGDVILGAVYLPPTDEFCFAEKGKGAFLNGKKIKCSEKKEWAYSYGLGGMSASPKNAHVRKVVGALSDNTAWVMAIASSAVAAVYVADGRRDWYISRGSALWDYAGPSIILKEAGCIVTNAQGQNWSLNDKEMFASNQYLHPTLIEMIQKK